MQSYLQAIPTDLLCEQIRVVTDLADIYQLLATLEQTAPERVGAARGCVTSIRSNKRNLSYDGFNLLSEFPNLVELRLPVRISTIEQVIQLASIPKLRSVVLSILDSFVSAMTLVVSPEVFSGLVRSFITAYVASGKELVGSAIYFLSFDVVLLSIVERSLTVGYIETIDSDTLNLVHKAGIRELWVAYNSRYKPDMPTLIWDRLHLIFDLQTYGLSNSNMIRNLYGAIPSRAVELHLSNREGAPVYAHVLSTLLFYFNEVTTSARDSTDSVPLLEIADFPFTSAAPVEVYPNLKRICFLVSSSAVVQNILADQRLIGIEIVFVRMPGSQPIPGAENVPEFPIETYIKQLQY